MQQGNDKFGLPAYVKGYVFPNSLFINLCRETLLISKTDADIRMKLFPLNLIGN